MPDLDRVCIGWGRRGGGLVVCADVTSWLVGFIGRDWMEEGGSSTWPCEEVGRQGVGSECKW